MDRGRVIRLVLIPIVAGLIVTLLSQRLMTQSRGTAAAPGVETAPVVTVSTKEAIPARSRLTEAQFTVKQVPKELVTGQEFGSVQELAGKVSMVDLQPGEVVLKARVVAEGQGEMPYQIPEGKRAVTIRMDELNGIAGYPEVGDLVDLILFLPEKQAGGVVVRPASSRILLEGVQVLAKGLADGSKASDGKLSSVTLALTPQAATEVTLAEQIGYIKMVLRPAVKQADVGSYALDENRYQGGAAGAQTAPGR